MRERSLSLRTSILLALLMVLAVYIFISHSILRSIVAPSFSSLEEEEARKDARRFSEALRTEVDHLGSLCRDWSAWDDMYRFAATPDDAFVDSNLVVSTFIDNGLNLLFIVDRSGETVWGRTYDFLQDRDRTISPYTGRVSWVSDDALFPPWPSRDGEPGKAVQGIVASPSGILLVASQPILTSNADGPPRGRVIMGRLFDEELLDSLRNRVNARVHAWPIGSPGIPEADADVLRTRPKNEEILIKEQSDSVLSSFQVIPDVAGFPALLVRVDLPREISRRGEQVLRYSLLSTVAVGAVILFVLHRLLSHIVIAPLEHLTSHTVDVGKSGILQKRIKLDSDNEISVLAREFNRMASSLADTRDRLLQQSHNSTAARQSSRIIHDLRNALSPLVHQLENLRDTVADWPASNVAKALKELEQSGGDTERARDLRRFIQAAAQRFSGDAVQLSEIVDKSFVHIGRVEEILVRQELLARAPLQRETVPVIEIVRDAVTLLPLNVIEHVRVRLDEGLSALPDVETIRPLAVQVLSDLIGVCATVPASADHGEPESVMVLGSRLGTATEMIRITILNTSLGNLDLKGDESVFGRTGGTFRPASTRVDLHDCANVVISLGGKIHAERAEGRPGFRFHVQLPVAIEVT